MPRRCCCTCVPNVQFSDTFTRGDPPPYALGTDWPTIVNGPFSVVKGVGPYDFWAHTEKENAFAICNETSRRYQTDVVGIVRKSAAGEDLEKLEQFEALLAEHIDMDRLRQWLGLS